MTQHGVHRDHEQVTVILTCDRVRIHLLVFQHTCDVASLVSTGDDVESHFDDGPFAP